MKNKKIVIGAVFALVLCVVFVLAYNLGKNKNVDYSADNSDNNAQSPIVDNSDCLPATEPYLKVISPNGGENFNTGGTFDLKWKTCNISKDDYISAELVDVNDSHNGAALLCEGSTLSKECLNDGTQSISLKQSAIVPGSYKVRIGIKNKNIQDFSDNIFTLSSTSESFKNKPGEVELIKKEANNKWILSVDLLTENPNWKPGVNERFLNQNSKIRNLNVSSSTKTYACGYDSNGAITGPTVLVNTNDFMTKMKNGLKYFDTFDLEVSAMYESCLP